MSVQGKTVMITGASRGIGEAAVRLFAEEGANVVLLARSSDAIEAIAAEIGEQAVAVQCDVTNYQAVEAAAQTAKGTFGQVDILINNAGAVSPVARLSESDPESWRNIIDINLVGVYHGIRAVLPDMIRQGQGTIINISSGAAYGPSDSWSHYNASKAGALMLTRSVDRENREDGIRSLGLSPGTVATEMQREIKASGIGPVSKLNWSDHIPPEWPARALLWMCSAEADEFLGADVMLREEDIRRRVGLVG